MVKDMLNFKKDKSFKILFIIYLLGLADDIVFLVAFLGIIALIFWVFWVTIKLKD